MSLEGKVAVVTGGARGIGRAISSKLASLGAKVVINDLCDEEVAKPAVDDISARGGEAVFMCADVSKRDEAQALIEKVVERFGRVDVLVNNAGITRDGLLVRMSQEDWDKVLAVNLTGTFNCTQAVARQMMKQRSGSIVSLASVVGVTGNAGQVNYAASKAGVIGLTKTVARELASRGVRANAVAPGFIDTEMTRKLPDDVRAGVVDRIPLARFGEPEDVAAVVAFLAGDDSAYVTGQVINIDGGMVM